MCAPKAGRQRRRPCLLAPRPSSAHRSSLCAGAWGSPGRNQAGLWSHGVHGPGGDAAQRAGAMQCDAGYPSPHPGPVPEEIRVWEPQVPSFQPKTQAPSRLKTGAPKVMPLGRMRRRMDARQAADTGHCISGVERRPGTRLCWTLSSHQGGPGPPQSNGQYHRFKNRGTAQIGFEFHSFFFSLL